MLGGWDPREQALDFCLQQQIQHIPDRQPNVLDLFLTSDTHIKPLLQLARQTTT